MKLKPIFSLFVLVSLLSRLAYSNPPPPPPHEVTQTNDGENEEEQGLQNNFVAFLQALAANQAQGSQSLPESWIPNPAGADQALRRLAQETFSLHERPLVGDDDEAPHEKRHRTNPENEDGADEVELPTEPIEPVQLTVDVAEQQVEADQNALLGRLPWDIFDHLAPFLNARDLLIVRTLNHAHRNAAHMFLAGRAFLHIDENTVHDLLNRYPQGAPVLEFFGGLQIDSAGQDQGFEAIRDLIGRLGRMRALILAMPHLSEQFMRDLLEPNSVDLRSIDFISLRSPEREYYAVTHLSVLLRELPELRDLGLYIAATSDGEMAALAHSVSTMSRLRSFALETTEPEDIRAIEWLARLFPRNSNIEFLVLGFGGNIGDLGVSCIIDIVKKCPKLRLLQVRLGHTVSEQGIRALLSNLHMPNLRSVFFFEPGGDLMQTPAWMSAALPGVFIKYLKECFPIEDLSRVQKEYPFPLM